MGGRTVFEKEGGEASEKESEKLQRETEDGRHESDDEYPQRASDKIVWKEELRTI